MHFKRGVHALDSSGFMLLRRRFTFLKKRGVHLYENNIVFIIVVFTVFNYCGVHHIFLMWCSLYLILSSLLWYSRF